KSQVTSNQKDLQKLSTDLSNLSTAISAGQPTLNLERMVSSSFPSTRFGTRVYGVAPSDFDDVFLTDNLIELARSARGALNTVPPRATDVRTYLRHELEAAYDLLEDYQGQIDEIHLKIKSRDYDWIRLHGYPRLAGSLRGDLKGKPRRILSVLSWCIAVEAGL